MVQYLFAVLGVLAPIAPFVAVWVTHSAFNGDKNDPFRLFPWNQKVSPERRAIFRRVSALQ